MASHSVHLQAADEERSWAGDFDPFSDPEERRVLFAAFDSFRQYRRTAHFNTTHRRRKAFYALPSAHWQMLAEPPFSVLDSFNKVDDAIDTNAEIAEAILAVGLESFDSTPTRILTTRPATGTAPQKAGTAEGQPERDVCYGPVLDDLRTEFETQRTAGEQIRVLVPGAGLGRLVFDICMAGYSAEGNEISYHQLLASSWVLNHTEGPQKHALFPFALHFSNLQSRAQQLQRIAIPDIHPGTAMAQATAATTPGPDQQQPLGAMSMSAADFVVLYMQPTNRAAFHAVATVFFIDTAPNLIRYIEAIRHCLQPGGLWINVGPLLWHFEDGHEQHPRKADAQAAEDGPGIGEPGTVELTAEEVLSLVERMGFRVEQRAMVERPLCGYIQDRESMLQNLYRPEHWVARKL
ncbi:hypothetical protein N7510_001441 [Penicillium lagena]|uniref:uncharacterized protein n=1 Tax=Penicillium lagena TaxID=94218 RepID=UPI00254109C4|nr:uncharacterized protein N7510_001441 [Penicillium lagena]KAJ5625132.1 hypothetical protein N7510_001441 [Penicillium lagena]